MGCLNLTSNQLKKCHTEERLNHPCRVKAMLDVRNVPPEPLQPTTACSGQYQ
jgi:hypothetical protein